MNNLFKFVIQFLLPELYFFLSLFCRIKITSRYQYKLISHARTLWVRSYLWLKPDLFHSGVCGVL